MTQALSLAWDQLVPFLKATPQQADSAGDIAPTIQAAMAAADTGCGGVYFFSDDEWLAFPEIIPLDPATRRHLRQHLTSHAPLQCTSADNTQWLFAALVADQQVIGAIGIGDPNHPFTAVDLRIITRMAERAASQITTSQLALSREREAAALRDMEIANNIQRSIQPDSVPRINGVQAVSYWQPARMVGGDAWGWVIQPDGRLAWFILDVSGKGLPAALAAVSLHTAIRLGLRMGLMPADVLHLVNDEFYDAFTRTSLIATAAILSFDPACGLFEQANAGHPPTLIHCNGVWHHLEATVPPIGVLPDLAADPQQLQLDTGATIICYSDGFSEIETETGLWMCAGIEQAVTDLTQPVEAIRQQIVTVARQIQPGRDIHDDQTLIVVKTT